VKKRVGIFGGTFDPPHLGHLILAEEIRERVGLDEVHFVPCNEPPHKKRPNLTEASHRYAMVVAATLQNPSFVPSPIEVNRSGASYSIDTVRQLVDELGDEVELYFVAGLDSFLEIESWREWEALLGLCHFVVVSRPGSDLGEIGQRLPDDVGDRIVDLSGDAARGAEEVRAGDRREGESTAGEAAVGESGAAPLRVFLCDAVYLDLSSTEVRDRVAEGRTIRYRVPAEVERYVRIHGLYAADPAHEQGSP
jgi:nicotinate-nucleotide adenylyltransferase